jgi:ribonuclease-3
MEPLPHSFADPGLLRLALTHSSTHAQENNERLEFLGDAVLDLVVAHELFEHHPDAMEGQLTELKAWVVSRRTLAETARELGLEDLAYLGPGLERRSAPRSVLANLYEAVLGAVYLDAGFEPARAFALATLRGPLDRARDRDAAPNPKQELQQLSQLETGTHPSYVLVRERGQSHSRAFCVAAEVGEQRFPSAWGRTRKEAERWAAHEALLVLRDDDGKVDRAEPS